MNKTSKQRRAEYKKAVKALSALAALNTVCKAPQVPTGKTAAQKVETEQQTVKREGRY